MKNSKIFLYILFLFFLFFLVISVTPLFCETVQELIEEGVSYSKKGDISKAIEIFEKVVVLDPADARTCTYLARLYLEIENYDKAIENYKKAIELDPSEVLALGDLGSAYLHKGMTDEALLVLEKAVDLDKNDIINVFNLAKLYCFNKQFDKARPLLELTIELGQKQQNMDTIESAKKILNDISLNSIVTVNNKDIRDVFSQGIQALNNDNFEKALSIFDSIEAMSGTVDVDLWLLKENGVVSSKEFLKAVSRIEQKSINNPEDAKLHYFLGRLYRFKAFSTPTRIEYYNGTKIEKGRDDKDKVLEKAIHEFQKSIEIDTYFTEAYYYLGTIYSLKRDFKNAIIQVDRAILNDPNNYRYYEYIAGLYCAVGDLDRAYINYSNAIRKVDSLDDKTIIESINFAKKRIELLKALIDINEVGKLSLQSKPFEGYWRMYFDKINKNESKYLDQKELIEMRTQMEKILQSQEEGKIISITQNGNLLSANTETETYQGICYDKWFVLTTKKSSQEADFFVQREQFISGKIVSDDTLEGADLMQQQTNDPEKYPRYNFIHELSFRAKKE